MSLRLSVAGGQGERKMTDEELLKYFIDKVDSVLNNMITSKERILKFVTIVSACTITAIALGFLIVY